MIYKKHFLFLFKSRFYFYKVIKYIFIFLCTVFMIMAFNANAYLLDDLEQFIVKKSLIKKRTPQSGFYPYSDRENIQNKEAVSYKSSYQVLESDESKSTKSQKIYDFQSVQNLPSPQQTYPWTFFRQNKLATNLFELDTSFSYFINADQFPLFFGLKMDYHNANMDIHLSWIYSFIESENYFYIGDFAFIFPFISDKWTTILGFKDVLWSEADRYWNYGLWSPRYLLDIFRPVYNGMPGLFLHYKGQTSLLLLVSYFYLPDINIRPQLKEKSLYSENPFFSASLPSDVHWNIDEKKLKLFQIHNFFKPVAAFQIKHSGDSSHITMSYAYKPRNKMQYFIAFDEVEYDLVKPGISSSIKDFKYALISHHLVAIEGQLTLTGGFSLLGSVFYENPIKYKDAKEGEIHEEWISDSSEPHVTFSIISYFEESFNDQSKTLFTFGYTKTMEDLSIKQTRDKITENLESAFNSGDFDWKEALSASLEYYSKSVLKGFLFQVRLNYALDNLFYALFVNTRFYLTSSISLYAGGDHIFKTSSIDVSGNTSAAQNYGDLSRMFLGMKYVF